MVDEHNPAPVTQMVVWRYEIKYGPDVEENYAWVYCGKDMVATMRTHHAMYICKAMNSHALVGRLLVTGDLVNRLRAKKTNMSHGRDMVEQQWPASDLEIEAAEAIERLEAVALEQAKGMLRQLEACEAYRARAEAAEEKLCASSPAPQEKMRGTEE